MQSFPGDRLVHIDVATGTDVCIISGVPRGNCRRNAPQACSSLPCGHPRAEYTNGTSFYFDRQQRTCKRIAFPVGILTPDWLANATYLGADTVDMRPCHVWTKSDGFIRYWADQRSGVPVRWIFFDGAQVGPCSSVMSDWCSWHGCCMPYFCLRMWMAAASR